MVGKMAAFQIQNLLVAYKERFDKDNFIKNLLLDNLLLVDIYSRAKKLHIQTDAKRVAMIVETGKGKDNNVLELLRSYFGTNSKEFVTAVDENSVIVVKELADGEGTKEVDKAARGIEGLLRKEGVEGIRISYGTVVGEIKEVNVEPIQNAISSGYIPIIATVAGGYDGNVYNINADLAAAQIAAKLGAKKLILMTDIRGLLRDVNDENSLISVVNVSEVPMLKRDGIIKGGMIPKIDCCVEAVRSGVNRAHIIDGRLDHSILLELFSDDGIGTMFY